MFKSIAISWMLLAGTTLSAQPISKSFQVYPSAAFYSGDSLRSMTLGGVSLVHQINRTVWIGIDSMAGTLAADRNNGMNVKSGELFLTVDGALYWNLPALLGVSVTPNPREGTGADLYTSVGAGYMWIGRHGEVFGFVGGGMSIFLPISWLVIRFDLKNLFFMLPNTSGSDFNSDMVLSLGPSLTF